ncbi:Tigger transposable element-derived protein 4-like [Oopsacas minuta]|uniref:Tigger transposable element-derived protein 4-like n=1 Tax=Oopsacas minuta TaxID=111878 RepID=A0AAV7JMC3_9METZ|nr:Tigger transposable element-derived protein 4-like [Oopsacas minuta]
MLLVDNCPAHLGLCEKYDGVKANLKLVMLPKNTTAKLQPCDQGVIRSLKAHYRGKLARLILNKEAKSVSLYEGLCMVRLAWSQVTTEVVVNCWKKSRLNDGKDQPDVDEAEVADKDLDDVGEVMRMANIEDMQPVAHEPVPDLEAFLATLTLHTDVGIEDTAELPDGDESDMGEDGDEKALASNAHCLKFLSRIKNRLIYTTGQTPDCLVELQSILMHQPQQQAKIIQFFPLQ